MISEAIRRNTFWILDLLKGSIIKKHYNEIEKVMSGTQKNTGQLNALLHHAIKTVPYYNHFDSNSISINELPIINKDIYRKEYDLFQSGSFLDLKIHHMSTSGSTGTPFTVNQDMNKRARTVAELIYFNEIEGQKLGDRYLYFKAWPKKKTKLESIKQNVIPIDVLHLNTQTLEKIREVLKKDRRIKSTLAYASSYEILADYLIKKGDTPDMFSLKTIFSSSSLLQDDTREKLQHLFGCSIVDRYSNQENGVLAQSHSNEKTFYINKASYYIELLKLNSDEPVKEGEIGRIVVTDLYNFAMPIIRYDTGDLAISDDVERTNLSTLRNIQGRRVDVIYDTKGNMLTPHTWSVYMRKYEKLIQWQFIQEDKMYYVLKVNGAEGNYTKEDFDGTLRSVLGKDAKIEIHFVDEIPVLASGKFKNTICKYNPSHKNLEQKNLGG